ncbi:MAG: hypothetical protein CL419_01560, partial [Acidimicrobiaceae bacterium]|nr:hypothetical protein [Acidimicrobiaceae bacterium]
MGDPAGKVAVVTGAASGIGRALVDHAAALGMQVVACDVAASALTGFDDAVVTHAADVADADAVEALAVAVFERFGAVHLLCNNAGV